MTRARTAPAERRQLQPAVRARDFAERMAAEGHAIGSPGFLLALRREFSAVEEQGAQRAGSVERLRKAVPR